MTKIKHKLSTLVFCFVLQACQEDPIYTYTELGGKPSHFKETSNSQREVSLRWETPATWDEQGRSPFLMAKFQLVDGVQVTLSTLAGDGGGLLSNLERWLAQLGVRSDPSRMKEWLSGIESVQMGQWSFQRLDFSYWSPSRESYVIYYGQSIDHVVVVKASGDPVKLNLHQDEFLDFVKSLKEKTGATP